MRDAIRSKLASLLAIFRTVNETHDGNGNKQTAAEAGAHKKRREVDDVRDRPELNLRRHCLIDF